MQASMFTCPNRLGLKKTIIEKDGRVVLELERWTM